MMRAAALLRSPEKASKETLRLAALGREVERMKPWQSLHHDSMGWWVNQSAVFGRGKKNENPDSGEPVSNPLAALRAARIAKKKGRKA